MKKTHKILMGALVAASIVAILLWWAPSRGRLNCTKDFENWDQAYEAWKAGALYLDRDKDSIPCENLLPSHGRK